MVNFEGISVKKMCMKFGLVSYNDPWPLGGIGKGFFCKLQSEFYMS